MRAIDIDFNANTVFDGRRIRTRGVLRETSCCAYSLRGVMTGKQMLSWNSWKTMTL